MLYLQRKKGSNYNSTSHWCKLVKVTRNLESRKICVTRPPLDTQIGTSCWLAKFSGRNGLGLLTSPLLGLVFTFTKSLIIFLVSPPRFGTLLRIIPYASQ